MIILPTFADAALWLLLGIAVILLLANMRIAWVVFLLFLIYALILSRISVIGAGAVALGISLAWALGPKAPGIFAKIRSPPARALLHAGLTAWCIAMALHLFPGFRNLLVLDGVISGPASGAFTLYFNLDKPMIVFALLLAYPGMSGARRSGRIELPQLGLLAICFVAIAIGVLAVPTIKPEFTVPQWWWLFALNNLLLTCTAEEAFFRGYLQNSMVRHTNRWVGIGLASIVFGMAHFAGGPVIIVLACLAGLLYGLTYHFSGSLIAAVVVHFTINMIHLVFFTYPIAVQ